MYSIKMTEKDRFYSAWLRGYNSTIGNLEVKKLIEQTEYPCFVLTHHDMKRDRFQARELGVLAAMNDLTRDSRLSDKRFWAGSMMELIIWARNNQAGVVFPRYGFLFDTTMLHNLEGVCCGHILGLSVTPSDYSYWKYALWMDDLKDSGLYSTTSTEGTTALSKSDKGWFIRSRLKSYKVHPEPLKTVPQLTQAINDCLTAGHFVGDSNYVAVEWIDIALAKDFHPELHADQFAKAEYRVHVDLEYNSVMAAHLYDDCYFMPDVPKDVLDFAVEVSKHLGYSGYLVAIDVARLTDGSLRCVEVNCGEMAGTLCPEDFYPALLK
jgi:hypothetical protein